MLREVEPWKGGVPSSYREEHCQGVIDAGKAGKTLTWFAASIETSREQLYDWQAAFPSFRHACKRARSAFQAFWEDRFAQAVGDRNQNSNAILTFLQVTCADFRPNATVEHKVSLNVKSLSREELQNLAAGAIDVTEVDTNPLAQVQIQPLKSQLPEAQRELLEQKRR